MKRIPTAFPTMTLACLPNEMLLKILRTLNHRDLLKCCLVCRLVKKVVETYAELQYIIELGREGMIDTGLSVLSHAERLSMLRDRREAWASLTWKKQTSIVMKGPCQAYEIAGGLFVKAHGGKDFYVSWLPTSTNTNEGKEIFRADLGMPRTQDFAIDPSQDLIIFLEDDGRPFSFSTGRDVELHIRTISTHEPHPDASSSSFCFSIPPNGDRGNLIRSAFLQIADDIFALFLSTGPQGSRLLLWNWRTGYLIIDADQRSLPPCTSSFSFLGPRAYLLTSFGRCGSVQIFSFGSSAADGPPIRHATLCLPDLQEGVSVHYLNAHTGPYCARSLPDKAYTTSPTSFIHILSVQYSVFHVKYCLFVHNHTFMQYIPSNTNTPPEFEEKIISWDQWGPKQTRFLIPHIPFTRLRYAQGQRVVCPPRGSGSTLQVLDFNVHPSLPHEQVSNGTVSHKTFTTPTRLPSGIIFKREVVTSLPYHLTSRIISEHYSAYMLDEERIVGLKEHGLDENTYLKELHIYAF